MAITDLETHYIQAAKDSIAKIGAGEHGMLNALISISIAISQQRIANAAEQDARDFFAGFALAGIVAHSYSSSLSESEQAQDAFVLADAMMKARTK